MTSLQKSIYRDALKRSRKAVLEGTAIEDEVEGTGKTKGRKMQGKKNPKDQSTNVLMDLRKAASHPMLFRRLFDDSVVKTLAKQCMKEPEFMDSNYNYIVEDMEVMTDAELQAFCLKYKVEILFCFVCDPFLNGFFIQSTRKFARGADCYEDAGKIEKLLELLDQYKEKGRRILIFSQVCILTVLSNPVLIRFLSSPKS